MSLTQALLEMSSFRVKTRSISSSTLIISLVKNRLLKTAPDVGEPPFQFIHTMDMSVVDTMLHDSPDLVIHSNEIWAVCRPQVGHKKVLRCLTQQFNCCTCAAPFAAALSCWNTKVVNRHSAYRWQQYDVIMTSWSSIEEVSKRYHQNFLLCNNNEIAACIADLFNSFCEEVFAVAVQQQTISEVRNSIMCLWVDNFCLQQWKLIKMRQHLWKLCSNEKGSSFLTHCVVSFAVTVSFCIQCFHCTWYQLRSASIKVIRWIYERTRIAIATSVEL